MAIDILFLLEGIELVANFAVFLLFFEFSFVLV